MADQPLADPLRSPGQLHGGPSRLPRLQADFNPRQARLGLEQTDQVGESLDHRVAVEAQPHPLLRLPEHLYGQAFTKVLLQHRQQVRRQHVLHPAQGPQVPRVLLPRPGQLLLQDEGGTVDGPPIPFELFWAQLRTAEDG